MMSEENGGDNPQPDDSEPDIAKQYMTNLVESLQPEYDIENLNYDEMAKFFQRRGAVELIAFLGADGYRFDEIDDQLDISRGYLNDRRNEALDLGLIEPDQELRGESYRRVWVLTALGEGFKNKLNELDIVKRHQRLVRYRNEYEEKKEEFLQWADDPDDLEEFLLLLNKPDGVELEMSRFVKMMDKISEKNTENISEADFDHGSGG